MIASDRAYLAVEELSWMAQEVANHSHAPSVAPDVSDSKEKSSDSKDDASDCPDSKNEMEMRRSLRWVWR